MQSMMQLPKNVTRLYVTGYPINYPTMGLLMGKNEILVKKINKISKQSAIVDVLFGYEGNLKNLIRSPGGYSVKRIFKSANMGNSPEKRTFIVKDEKTKKPVMENGKPKRIPVSIGFVLNTTTNFLGLINGKKLTVGIECKGIETLKKQFVESMMKIRDEKEYDIVFDPEKPDIVFHIKTVESQNRCPNCKKVVSRPVYYITWIEGQGFTNE